MRSFLHFRADPTIDRVEPSKAARDEAWEHREEIVKHLTEAIKKPDPRAVPVTDPGNAAAFVAAVRSAADRWQVNLATVVDIAARYEEQLRAAAESRPTPQALYDQAFAELALGDYTASSFTTRRAANLALELLQTQPIDEPFHREAALNALLLLHEAAKAAHDTPAAIAALEEAGALVDQEANPLLWAEIHESLVRFLLEHAKLDRAHDLISDIIDIREERQGEGHRDLAGALLLWAELLDARANYSGVESVAARAGRIYARQNPDELSGFASALNSQALALQKESRLTEAEPLMRRALEIDEKTFGPAHPKVAAMLNNLAQLLQATNRFSDAEPLMRRALAIDEASLGPDHPDVATDLNNLAHLLRITNRLSDAEPLMQRQLEIFLQFTAATGHEHPHLRVAIANYSLLLEEMGRSSAQIRAQLEGIVQSMQRF